MVALLELDPERRDLRRHQPCLQNRDPYYAGAEQVEALLPCDLALIRLCVWAGRMAQLDTGGARYGGGDARVTWLPGDWVVAL